MYAKCEKCRHLWLIRGKSLRKQNGDRKQCPRCGTTQIVEATKEEFEAAKPESKKPSPQTIPRDPTKAIDKSVDDDLKLHIPDMDTDLYSMEVEDYKRRVIAVRNKELEAREARLDRQQNNGDSEVQKLREQVQELRMANMQNQFSAQLQGLQTEFRMMTDAMNRPGADPVDTMMTNLTKLRQNDVLGQQTSVEIEAIKNHGRFLDKTMGIVDKRMESLDNAIREYVNFKKELAMERKKARIRGDTKLLDGVAPSTGSRRASPEDLERMSDLLVEDLAEKEVAKRVLYRCKECGNDHLETSKIGLLHAQYRVD